MLHRGWSGWRVAATVLVFLSLVACRTDGDADGPAPTNGSPGATTPDTEARPAASLGAEENGPEPESDPAAAVSAGIDDDAAARAERLAAVRSWAYQLQGSDDSGGVLTLAAVAAHGADLLVVDSSRDGSDAGLFTEAELAPLQADGTIVLAYLSIGEAESYRDYFDPTWLAGDQPGPNAPSWLGPTNPDFPDNYKVRYWEPGWQAIILGASGALPRLVAAGFDGVYLDIIDAYEFWEERRAAAGRTAHGGVRRSHRPHSARRPGPPGLPCLSPERPLDPANPHPQPGGALSRGH